MTIQLKSNGFWIQSPFGGNGVQFRVRDPDPVEMGRFRRSATTIRVVGENETVVRDVDEETVGWLMFNYMVLEWEGIDDEDGKPLPCNNETKRMLFSQHQLGVQKLLLKYGKIKLEEDKKEEDTLKNSKASSGSGSTSRKSDVQPVTNG